MCAFVLLLLAGCRENGTGSAQPPGSPPPPSADNIQAQFNAILAPLYELVETANADSPVAPELSGLYGTRLEEARQKLSSSPAYPEGVNRVINQLEDSLRAARDTQNGALVLLLCDIVRRLDPNNARLPRFEKWGEMVKNRPVVVIRGWYEPRDTETRTIYAFLEVFTPEDGKVHHVQVREGEEFLNLRFEKTIGNKAGIRLIYVVTGDEIEIYSPSWRRRQ